MLPNVPCLVRLDELLRVTALVSVQRDSSLLVHRRLPGLARNGLGRFALGINVCPRHYGAGNQAVAILVDVNYPDRRVVS